MEIEENMPLIKWNVETLTGTYFFCLLILLDYYLNYFRHYCRFCQTFFLFFSSHPRIHPLRALVFFFSLQMYLMTIQYILLK